MASLELTVVDDNGREISKIGNFSDTYELEKWARENRDVLEGLDER